jgi:N-myristoyl transferase
MEFNISKPHHNSANCVYDSVFIDEKITTNGPIELDKSPSEIRAEPYSLPPGFQWDTLNLDDPLVLEELYKLLNENYVEDEDSMFRFDYPQKFLQW